MVSMEMATRMALPQLHEVKVNDMIDGGLEALLDLRDNEFEEEGMVDDHNGDKCDENDNDYFYNQF